MENIGMFYLMFIWPLAVGWYGSEHKASLFEVIAVGLLPMMMVLALK